MNQKYSPEMRERALRMLDKAKPAHLNLMAAARHVDSVFDARVRLVRTICGL